jgi:hypothetical protein
MTAACVGTPVSWLRLEQLELGQLAEPERVAIAAHIDGCAACRDCRDQLRSAPAVALRPLVVPPPRPRWRWLALGTTGFAAAAAIAMAIVWILRGGAPGGLPGPRVAVKGGEIAIHLVRESGGSTALEPTEYLPGDRFKVRVTCPPGRRAAAVTVYQSGRVYRPLAEATIACGNDVGIPGAFRLDGDQPARVCLQLAGAPIVCSEPIHRAGAMP